MHNKALQGKNYAPQICGSLRSLYHKFAPLRISPERSVMHKGGIMPHPQGSNGNPVDVALTFDQVFEFVGVGGADFLSTTNENMVARRGHAGDGVTPVIILEGERNVHGRVCAIC